MPIPILMPALSPTMTEGNLVKWSKNIGDKVEPGDVIAEVETDKATMEIESVDEGKLDRIMFKEGAEGIVVNSLIAVLSLPKDTAKDIQVLIDKHAESKLPTGDEDNLNIISENNISNLIDKNESKKSIEEEIEIPSTAMKQNEKHTSQLETNKKIDNIDSSIEKNKILASPLARRLAEIHGLDLNQIEGSGPKGKIVKIDIEKLTLKYSSLNKNINSINKIARPNKKIKISSMRKTIAKKLSFSKTSVPHFYLTVECNVKKLLDIRKDINNAFISLNKISINDIVIKSLASALIEVPEANCSWQDDHIVIYGNVDISVAVAVDEGLYTPVIRGVNDLGLKEISMLMKDYITRAKNNELLPEEYEGGNFTISNLGMYEIDSFSAIINPPQSGIITIGTIQKVPLVIDDMITNSYTMKCQLSGDHRVIDGVVGAKLLQSFKSFIENPSRMLL